MYVEISESTILLFRKLTSSDLKCSTSDLTHLLHESETNICAFLCLTEEKSSFFSDLPLYDNIEMLNREQLVFYNRVCQEIFD